MTEFLGKLLEQGIYWLIPLFLLCSFLVNHKTLSNKDGSAPKEQKSKPKAESKAPSSRDKEGSMSDKDMTGT